MEEKGGVQGAPNRGTSHPVRDSGLHATAVLYDIDYVGVTLAT